MRDLPGIPPRVLALVRHRDRHHSAAARAFVEEAQAVCAELTTAPRLDGRHVTTLRRLAFPLRLVAARLGAGGERALLVAVGVVAGAAVLAAVLAGRLVMQDRVARASRPPSSRRRDRVVQVAWSGAVDSFAHARPLRRAAHPRG